MNITKFNFAEALNNSKGKSSLGLFSGLVWGMFAVILSSFGAYLILKSIPGYEAVFTQAALYLTASGTIIGTRYWKKDKEIINEPNNNQS